MVMDTITAAYSGLKVAKDIFTGVAELKIEADSIVKINDAVKKVGDAQDVLFQLRGDLFNLQEQNNELKQQIDKQNDWNSRIENYELVKTEGGAIVYKSKNEPAHYICTTCKENNEIQILQDNRTHTGKYRCVKCKAEFPVNPQVASSQRKVISKGII